MAALQRPSTTHGVYFHKLGKKWKAKANFNGKLHNIGTFTTQKAAALARDAAVSARDGPSRARRTSDLSPLCAQVRKHGTPGIHMLNYPHPHEV